MPAKPDERRREELLERLRDVMLEEGFSGWRIGALATRLHCSRSTLYKLAPSKDALVLRLLNDVVSEGMDDAKSQASRLDSPAESITRYAEVLHEWQNRGSLRFWTDVSETPATQALIDALSSRGQGTMKEFLDRGISTGRFRPANTIYLARVIWQAARITRIPAFLDEAGLDSGEAMDELGLFIVHGMSWPAEQG